MRIVPKKSNTNNKKKQKKTRDTKVFFFMKLIGFINKLKMRRRNGLREKYCSIPDGD